MTRTTYFLSLLSLCVVCLTQAATNRAATDFPAKEHGVDKLHAHQNDGRSLQSNTCPFDNTMTSDTVWYEVFVMLTTSEDVVCDEDEWRSIGNFVEFKMNTIDLWANGIHIVDLDPHICSNPPSVHIFDRVRRGLHENSTDASFIFHLFYRGSGRCLFCDPDDDDRRRELEEAQQQQQQQQETPSVPVNLRRRTTCGGCHSIDFSTYGNGNPITGTPYIKVEEYWDSHGVKIRGYGGYTPHDKARIYDTTFHASNNYHGDPDLGSPNEHCPGGGPGRGNGGRPTLNGQVNPGANCNGEGNVLIIQESNKSYADDNGGGGLIQFEFRYAVTLGSIGFMDMDDGNNDYVKVFTEDGDVFEFAMNGFGDNSIETLQFDHPKVTKVDVKFTRSGAIRFIDFCHDCGEAEAQLEAEVNSYYPPTTVRSYENDASVYHFYEILPLADAALSTEIQDDLRSTYHNDPSSCMYQKNPQAFVSLAVSTPAGNSCS